MLHPILDFGLFLVLVALYAAGNRHVAGAFDRILCLAARIGEGAQSRWRSLLPVLLAVLLAAGLFSDYWMEVDKITLNRFFGCVLLIFVTAASVFNYWESLKK